MNQVGFAYVDMDVDVDANMHVHVHVDVDVDVDVYVDVDVDVLQGLGIPVMFTTTAAVLHGHSGGAVMLPSGDLVGIVASCACVESTRTLFHHVNYCLPVAVIHRFLSHDYSGTCVQSTAMRYSSQLREDVDFSTVWQLAVPKHLGSVALASLGHAKL
jgi:hypothetical protein